MDVRGALSKSEIETFLADRPIPVRLACRTPADHLWMVSLWYRYRDGRLICATAKKADIVRFLEHDPRVAFEVSTNDQPYRGVRGRGVATITADEDKAALRTLLERYQGGTDTPLAEQLLREDRKEVAITVEPAVVYGWDFSDRMSGETADPPR
jgi:nitroimidazol reductase NimA-like FMN-containing flavoprotein (pyridoxamine 5'-phosphate oxidase superfamily)